MLFSSPRHPTLGTRHLTPESRRRNTVKFHFIEAKMGIAFAIIIVGLNVLIPALSLAASKSEIDRSATQVLTTLYKNTPGAKTLADKAVAVLVFPSIVKGGFIIAGQSVMERCAKKARRLPITDRWRGPMDSRPAFRRLATCCFSWTMNRFSISTIALAGSLERDRAWSCWTRGSVRFCRQQHFRRVCMLLFSIRRD